MSTGLRRPEQPGETHGRSRLPRRNLLAVVLLLAAILAVAAWWSVSSPSWPARLIIRTGGLSLDEFEKQPVTARSRLCVPQAVSPDGKTLLAAHGGSAVLLDTVTGRETARWAMPGGRDIYQACFSPDGRTVAAITRGPVGQNLTADLVDVSSGKIRTSLPTPGVGIVHGGLAFMDGGEVLRVLVQDGQNRLVAIEVDVSSGRETARRTLSCRSPQSTTHASPDGRQVAIATTPFARGVQLPELTDVVLWDAEQDREATRIAGSTAVTTITVSDDGTTVAIGRTGGAIEVWDVATRTRRAMFHPHRTGFAPRMLWLSPDGSALASLAMLSSGPLSLDGLRWRVAAMSGRASMPPDELSLLDASRGELLLRTRDESVPCFSGDGRIIATLHRDGTILLRDMHQP
ncbi:MAG: WD40 repeat domain-containing protein [Isosphaeraceae bacterium]